jgi:hypothetical protein
LYNQLHRQLLAQQGKPESDAAQQAQSAVNAQNVNAQGAQSAITTAITGSGSPK